MSEEMIKEKSYKRVIAMWIGVFCILVFQYILEVYFYTKLDIFEVQGKYIRVLF